jgi:hypothetical protein
MTIRLFCRVPRPIRAPSASERVRGPTPPLLATARQTPHHRNQLEPRAPASGSADQLPYANGVTPSSPGLPRSGYPGITDQSNNSTLKGLRHLPSNVPQPRWG